MDEILCCEHSNETSSAVLTHGTINLVCALNFWVCGRNPAKSNGVTIHINSLQQYFHTAFFVFPIFIFKLTWVAVENSAYHGLICQKYNQSVRACVSKKDISGPVTQELCKQQERVKREHSKTSDIEPTRHHGGYVAGKIHSRLKQEFQLSPINNL